MKVKLMSHEDRLKLINAPFPTLRIYGGSAWGGSAPAGEGSGGSRKPTLEQLEGSVSYAGREFGGKRE